MMMVMMMIIMMMVAVMMIMVSSSIPWSSEALLYFSSMPGRMHRVWARNLQQQSRSFTRSGSLDTTTLNT